MYRKLLVPLDGTAQDEAVLSRAIALAGQADGEVVLVRVVASDLSTRDDAATAEAASCLGRAAARVARDGLRATVVVHQGDEAAEIVRAAAKSGADAVVMAARRGEAGVAEAVARAVPGRLFLVGPHEEAAPPPVASAPTARRARTTVPV
jgi:nucleotide-binding universal stress UspA family protein